MSYFKNKKLVLLLGIVCFSLNPGCSSLQIKQGKFSPYHRGYTINIPEKGWQPIRLDKEDIALWNEQYNATIAIISSNVESKKLPPEMVANELFIGIKNKKTILKEMIIIDNQKAIHTLITGDMDDYRLKIDSYVIPINNKVYDLVYWAPLDMFDFVHNYFQDMVKTIRFTH